MARMKLDKFREEAGVDPYELEVDDGRVITIMPPTTETMIEIGKTPVFEQEKLLKLLCGDAFDEIWKAISEEQGNVGAQVVTSVAKHFKMGTVGALGGFGASPR